MAKQNKKFVATTLTAAMVASAVAPVAGAAFTDSIPTYAKDAVGYVTEKGIMNGLGGTTEFGAAKNITRAEVAVLLSNALGLDTKGKTASFSDVPATHWASGAIAAVVEAGIAQGTGTGFNPAGQITRQEAAVMFANAYKELKLNEKTEVSFKDESKVATWAKGQVEVLASLGIFGGKTGGVFAPTDLITRGEVATLVHRTEVADVRLKVEEVVTNATKVESVSATNLKEVVVTFDGTVDKTSASEVANYSLSGANTPEVDSVAVSEDAKTVTLTVKDYLVNQNDYKVTVNNVKAGNKVINEKDLAFKPLDNTIPTVAKVEALGNKTIRVLFSEPVKTAQTSQFHVDGKVVVGSIQTTGKTAIIKLSSALTDGEHTLTAEGISDYANFKVVKADTKFNVVEDKTAPTVEKVVSASFEKVTLKFSEPVEQVFASNVYWMQGASKRTASSVKPISDDTFEFTFNDPNKLVYTTDLYVTNVRDYSGNVIDKDTKVQVTPVIDQTRPEVLSAGFVKDSDNKKIVIKFSKSLDTTSAGKAANYVIKDKDGKTQLISSSVDTSKDKEVTITLLNTLKDNTDYTLEINGVSDNTTLKNVILPYSTTLSVKDVTPPTLTSVTRLNNTQLYLQFSEAMATSGDGSVVDAAKYTIKDLQFNKTLTPASFNVTGDAKGVIITFNDTLNADETKIQVKVQLVKDTAGNYISGLTDTQAVVSPSTTTVDTVTAVGTKKVEVEFTKAIQSLNQADFEVENNEILYSELSADGKTVTFTLKENLPEDVIKTGSTLLTFKVKANAQTVDFLGAKIASSTTTNIVDEIKATVDTIVADGNTGTKIKITFNEAVEAAATASSKTDFVIKDNLGKSVAISDITATGKDLVITLDRAVTAATVSAKNVRFVTDKSAAKNSIADIEATTVELGGDTQEPTISSPSNTPGAAGSKAVDVTITSDEAGTAYYLVLASGATAPTASTVAASPLSEAVVAATAKIKTLTFAADNTAYDVYVVVKDAAGNLSAVQKISVTTPAGV